MGQIRNASHRQHLILILNTVWLLVRWSLPSTDIPMPIMSLLLRLLTIKAWNVVVRRSWLSSASCGIPVMTNINISLLPKLVLLLVLLPPAVLVFSLLFIITKVHLLCIHDFFIKQNRCITATATASNNSVRINQLCIVLDIEHAYPRISGQDLRTRPLSSPLVLCWTS